MRELKIVHFFFDFGAIWTKMYFFPPLTLKMTVKVIFSRSEYQKAPVDDMLKMLSYHTLTSDMVWAVGLSKRKKNKHRKGQRSLT
jgi:hypothetical protein